MTTFRTTKYQDLSTPQTELIVDTRHYAAVATMLAKTLQVWPAADAEEAAELELTLIKGLDLAGYLPAARKLYANEISAMMQAAPARQFSDLDVLLLDLRTRFAADYGFVPVLGKNRDSMIGYPQHQATVFDPTPFPGTLTFSGTAGRGVTIGVVDTPLSPHQLLPADLVRWDVQTTDDGYPKEPWFGHATFVAGLIRQAAPGAKVHGKAGLNADSGISSGWSAARTIAGFAGQDIDILNLSLGCVTADNQPPLLMQRALEKVTENRSLLVVAAAGNRPADGYSHVWPAAATPVVAVGADKGGAGLAPFSMKEPWVECTAPGVDVPGPFPVGSVLTGDVSQNVTGLATWSGTSFSAATVSGKVAARMTQHNLSAQDALQHLLDDPTSGVRWR